jgi:hypothetical protein
VFLVIEAARSFPVDWFPAGRVGGWCAVLIGISGTIVWAEVGTTFGELPLAILVIGGILPLLRLAATPVVERQSWLRASGWSGLLVGLAVGLKLTAAVFAAPLALAVALSTPRARWVLPACMLVAAGGIVGFAVADGWWGWTVWQMFGSPIFPYLNDIFRSPWMPAIAGRDLRYMPSGVWQALFFPFSWLTGRAWVVAEISIRDPRYALAWLSVMLIGGTAAGAWTRRAERLREALAAVSCGRAMRFLLVFFVGSFAFWEWTFAYLRYILPLEALSGIVIVAGIKTFAHLVRPRSSAWANSSLAAVVVVIVAGTTYSHWGRAKAWGPRVFVIDAAVLPDGSRVIAATDAVSFVLPFLGGKNLTFVGLVSLPLDAPLAERVTELLAGDRPVYALTYYDNGVSALRAFGWDTVQSGCDEIQNQLRRGIMLCPVRRIAPSAH